MPKRELEFPKPREPYSLQDMVDKILAKPEFAKFIHGLVLEGGKGNQKAIDTVQEYFEPLPDELTKLGINKKLQKFLAGKDPDSKQCTSHFLLLDFAAPAQIWQS